MKTIWEQMEEAANGILSSPVVHSTWRRTYRSCDERREFTVEILHSNADESLRFTDLDPLELIPLGDALRANEESRFWKYALVQNVLVRQLDLFTNELDTISEMFGPRVSPVEGNDNNDDGRRLWAGLRSEIQGLRGDDDHGYSVEVRSPSSDTVFTIACTLNTGNHIRLTAPVSPAVPESESTNHYLLCQNPRLTHCRTSLDSRGRYALVAELSRSALNKGESLRLFSVFVDNLQTLRHIRCLADRAVSQIYSSLHPSTFGGALHDITTKVHSSSLV
jgi:hypothetical protein